MKYFTSRMREVLSARSSCRPRRAKCHASLWRHGGVGDALEHVAAQADVAEDLGQAAPVPACRRWPCICRYMLLTCSHISEEMVSRTERAFSRAARRQEEIELGLLASKVRNWITLSCVASP